MRAVVLVIRPRHSLELHRKYVHSHTSVSEHVAHLHVPASGVAVHVEQASQSALAVFRVLVDVEFVVFSVEVDHVGGLVVEVLVYGFVGVDDVL